MSEIDQLKAGARQNGDVPDATGNAGCLASFIAAVQFLTRLPLSPGAPVASTALHRAPLFFPLVGALVGICTTGLVALGCLIWPVWLAVPVALAAEALLTGALHEDAVADFCDAFGGGWTREEVLAILKDSRIGTYGALGLLVAVSVRAAATIALVLQCGSANVLIWGSAMVAASTIGQWIIVLAMVCVAPVPGRQSLTRDIGCRLTGRALLVSGLWGAPFVVLFASLWPLQCLIAAGVLAPVVWVFLSLVRRTLGGITGDCLGCLGYLSHVLVLLTAAARIEPWRAVS